MLYLIALVFVAGSIVIISIQNVIDVPISFFVWQFDISVSTLTIAAVLAGVIVAHLLRALLGRHQEQSRRTVDFISRRPR